MVALQKCIKKGGEMIKLEDVKNLAEKAGFHTVENTGDRLVVDDGTRRILIVKEADGTIVYKGELPKEAK
jgi:hypothetical protein